jgi:hypothetical protein
MVCLGNCWKHRFGGSIRFWQPYYGCWRSNWDRGDGSILLCLQHLQASCVRHCNLHGKEYLSGKLCRDAHTVSLGIHEIMTGEATCMVAGRTAIFCIHGVSMSFDYTDVFRVHCWAKASKLAQIMARETGILLCTQRAEQAVHGHCISGSLLGLQRVL